jgi:hypothetical protein
VEGEVEGEIEGDDGKQRTRCEPLGESVVSALEGVCEIEGTRFSEPHERLLRLRHRLHRSARLRSAKGYRPTAFLAQQSSKRLLLPSEDAREGLQQGASSLNPLGVHGVGKKSARHVGRQLL